MPNVRVELAGNNHFVFADKIQIGDRVYHQDEIQELTPKIFDGPFREAVWSRYGAYVGNYARHPIEFLPGFINERSRFGLEWGVEPTPQEINLLYGVRHDNNRAFLESSLTAARKDFAATANWSIEHSLEPLDYIVAAFHTGNRLDMHLNVRNQGGIQGVSDDLHLEMYCRIEEGQVIRPKVQLPEAVLREVERVGQCQLKLAACCDQYDEELLVEAIQNDALAHPDKEINRRILREMLEFEKEWIQIP